MATVNLATATTETLTRMLRRLPASLWNTSPEAATLQRDLYEAFAAQLAIWIEQREIARRMSLLLEAEGVDLDALMEDYGLRRYLQRPDAYARQVAMHILWHPKGTLYAVDRLSDLLFDLPHTTLRTGRSQQHVFVAATHPVTTPYSYWGLVSAEGLWYAVTVQHTVPVISQALLPGLDVSPGPHTLTWFAVLDELGATWYVSIAHDTLQLTTMPPSGYGTTEPFAVLDGAGNRWLLGASAHDMVLTTVLDTGLAGFGTWRLTSREGTVYYLTIDNRVPRITTSAPGGTTDQTPGGAPLDWFTLEAEDGTPWYVSVEHDTLVLSSTLPPGTGTASLPELLDVDGQRWVLSADAHTSVLVSTAMNPRNADLVLVAPDAPFQTFQLVDSANVPWWICMSGGTLLVTDRLPVGATDVTPAGGPYHWWRTYDLAGTRYYVWPLTTGVLFVDTTTPGGLGTAVPQTLGDSHGVLWHVGIHWDGTLSMSDAPPVSYGDSPTAICMTDPAGAKWFWRVRGQVLEWSSYLWPDTIDQSPWGELAWLEVLGTDSVLRYVFPDTLGAAKALPAPPATSTWGWQEPVRFRDPHGLPWSLTVFSDDRVGVEQGIPDDLPLATTAIPLDEALGAFAHVQAAGSLVTLLVT